MNKNESLNQPRNKEDGMEMSIREDFLSSFKEVNLASDKVLYYDGRALDMEDEDGEAKEKESV